MENALRRVNKFTKRVPSYHCIKGKNPFPVFLVHLQNLNVRNFNCGSCVKIKHGIDRLGADEKR
ncbi:MAG: hypothetical protein H6Q17_786 [Bacteroidetes bacterium]|nr:hypothetical protein [Bacteroidota bacterium]